MSVKEFKSETYASKILQNLYELWKSERFCDVEICCEDRIFKVHKTVLASSSNYFKAMFTSAMVEEKQQRIRLKSISCAIFDKLIEFVYTGQITLTSNTVQDVLLAADMLGLTEIVEFCTQYLSDELHFSNALGIYRFAKNLNCEALEKNALNYVYRNFPDVSEVDDFLEAPLDITIHLLSSENIKVDSEYQVLRAGLDWIRYDLRQRKKHTFKILKNVRLSLIPARLLKLSLNQLHDHSLRIAMQTMISDLHLRKGTLVNFISQPRECAKKHIYVIGGSEKELGSGWNQLTQYTLDTALCFEAFQKRWTQIKSMSIERILPGVATLDGLVYVVGGEQESKIIANAEVYDPQEEEWKMIEPMIIPRCAFGLAAWENYLFAFGGWVGEDIGGTIERYDPRQNKWIMFGELEEPRFGMGICSYEGLIYLAGGYTHEQRHLNNLRCYDPVTKTWSSLNNMKYPRSQMGVCVLGKHLYVIGGCTKSSEVLRSVEKYDFDKNEWKDAASLKIGRANPAVGAVDGKIYCIGGDQTAELNFFRAQVTLSSVEVYDPLSDSWEICSEELPESRGEAGYVVI